jgi:tetrapyrrole methylase family protein/MazG family protein
MHPTVSQLPAGPVYHTFDDLYEAAHDFEEVYATIVTRLVEALERGDVVYAVPGDPMVAEGTVTHLLTVCEEKGVQVRIAHGVSFIEPTLAALRIDAAAGLQILDATDVAAAHHPLINPDYPALIAQVYGQRLASDVKLTLMNQYPDEHPVTLVHAAGTPDLKIEEMPLYEIDRRQIAHLTTLYLPPFDRDGAVTSLEGFQQTIAQLRAPDGCPWDREQTHQTLRPYLLEETYEVLEAIDADQPDKLAEELGDLLLQIVLHSQIAVDEGEFYMAKSFAISIARSAAASTYGRCRRAGDAEQVVANWQTIKAAERVHKGEDEKSLLDGVPQALPALSQAHAYDQRARRVGFDWASVEEVIEKVQEEIGEIQRAPTPEERFMEIGDLLLASAVWARWLGVNPEDALRAANRRFYDRFTYIERRVRRDGRAWADVGLQEMLDLWNEATRATEKKKETPD